MEQEEQFASRKTSRSQVISCNEPKIRSIYKDQGGDQDGDPSHGLYNGFGRLPLQSAKAGWVIAQISTAVR